MTDDAITPNRANRRGLWHSAGVTHRGRVRRVNEDAFILRPDIGLWGVADGMGGHRAGDVASRMVVDALLAIENGATFATRLDRIDDAMEAVNRDLVELGADSSKGGMMGSTVALLTLDDSGLGAVMWAGDSRVYRLRDGQLQQLSTDHSQVEEYIRDGVISREEAASHPESNVITRALGSHAEEVLEADVCDTSAGDRFLLCSDGLTRHVTDAELGAFLATDDPETACGRLLQTTLDRGSVDNTTVVIVDIVGEPA